jgi:hypothetical protein
VGAILQKEKSIKEFTPIVLKLNHQTLAFVAIKLFVKSVE